MISRTSIWRQQQQQGPAFEASDDQILYNFLKNRRKGRAGFSLRAITGTRLQGWLAAGGIVISAGIVLGPWMWNELNEMVGNRFISVPATEMPLVSPTWWENTWRCMNPIWRAGESSDDFFVKPFTFIKSQTGRDLSSAEAFIETNPKYANSQATKDNKNKGKSRNKSGTTGAPTAVPDVLVPLCGDSPIMSVMALRGFNVEGVECSETAIRMAVERTERHIPQELYDRVHLRWNDFFSPELWDGPLRGRKFDVIYERQGITSINVSQRQDYAYLLKRALKEDGLIYVEGTFRTGRVKGNAVRGPPFSLSKKELEKLFPSTEGYFVRCEEKTDAMRQLSREDRLLQRVPKRYYVTPFDCVVFREATVNLEEREEPLKVGVVSKHIKVGGSNGTIMQPS